MVIRILPAQLAKQIAAGEVIDRPVSVVKELIENSLDAGATRIDVSLENGGLHLILVRDNGSGIMKSELTMALMRHATSKIFSQSDLQSISSLGFRGEALASISAISRISITSRTLYQQEAWKCYSEAENTAITLKPAAHPIGTSIQVLDLFYNMPARRKFMYSEKIEFMHVDELIKRIAIANLNVNLTLMHNSKLIHSYPNINHDIENNKRIINILGENFIKYSLHIDFKFHDLELYGWIIHSKDLTKNSQFHYFYVNKRIIKNDLINKVLRQAYEQYYIKKEPLCYVLYLTIDPCQLDINIHPTKRNVLFYQERLVHDFMLHAIVQALKNKKNIDIKDNVVIAGINKFMQPVTNPKTNDKEICNTNGIVINKKQKHNNHCFQHHNSFFINTENFKNLSQQPSTDQEIDKTLFWRVLSIVRQRYALVEYANTVQLLSLKYAENFLIKATLKNKVDVVGMKLQPLLIPLRLDITMENLFIIDTHKILLQHIGIDLRRQGEVVTLHALPVSLRGQNLHILISEILYYVNNNKKISSFLLLQWITYRYNISKNSWNFSQAVALISELEKRYPKIFKDSPSNFIQPINLDKVINALNYEYSTEY